jgi:DNA-binding response OmpR family regulator
MSAPSVTTVRSRPSHLAVVGYILPGGAQPGGVPPGIAEPAAALAVDHERRCARAGGKDIELTFQEFELLAFMAANPARVFTRAELLAYAWQRNDLLNTRTVDIHICRLRQKLGSAYASWLATEHRVGYRFRPPAGPS